MAETKIDLVEARRQLEAAGWVLLRAKSYRQAQERQRVAECLRQAAEERVAATEAWAREAFAEQRRLADRLTFVYGMARAKGATDLELVGDDVPPELDDAPADAPPKPPARPVPARVTVDPSILVWAFRYALGRRTYAPSDVAQALLEHRAALGAHDRRLIVEDIRAAIREGTAGAGCDVDVWESVADALTEVPA